MRKEKKAERALQGLQAWLTKSGVAEEVVKEAAEKVPVAAHDLSMQAEGVLLFLQKPLHFITKKCKECEEDFLTNYRSVAYCSDSHRAKALRRDGIQWTPYKKAEERWGGEPPLVIPPEARKRLVKMAQYLLSTEFEQESQSPEPQQTQPSVQIAQPLVLPQVAELPEQSRQSEPDSQTILEFSLPSLDEF